MKTKASGRVVCYRLEASALGRRELMLPEKSVVLRAEYFNGAIGLWALVPAELTGREALKPRKFEVIATGGTLEADQAVTYIGSAIAPSGTFVAHVFEIEEPQEERTEGGAGDPGYGE